MKPLTEKEIKELPKVNETLLKLIKDTEWQINYHLEKLQEQQEILNQLKK